MVDSTAWYDVTVTVQTPQQIGTLDNIYSFLDHVKHSDQTSWHIVPPMLAGRYTVCFSNQHATAGTKTIAFDFSVDDTDVKLHRSLAEHGDAAAVQHEVAQLAEKLHEFAEGQLIMRRREESARDTSESTNARIQWFSLGELALISGLALAQVKAITSFVGSGQLLG